MAITHISLKLYMYTVYVARSTIGCDNVILIGYTIADGSLTVVCCLHRPVGSLCMGCRFK